MSTFLKNYIYKTKLLINAVPTIWFSVFIVVLFAMNLLANKSINIPHKWLALDCGVIISWVLFFIMDIFTKHFGPKAATTLSIAATLISLIMCFVFFIASIIPGMWGEAYVTGSENIINNALNKTFGGTWYVIFGSTVAFIFSAAINNFTNFWVGKIFKNNPNGLFAYISRAYVSTAIGQFADNFIFAFTVSRIFFGWSLLQCVMSAVFGMFAEFLCEAVFAVLGYKVCEKWRKENVGKTYFEYIKGKK